MKLLKHAAPQKAFHLSPVIKVVRCWALMGPDQLPVVFRTRTDAEENADEDEQLFKVEVVVLKRVTKRRRAFLGIP